MRNPHIVTDIMTWVLKAFYVCAHIYFAIFAFLKFQIWYAIIVTMIPAVGDVMLIIRSTTLGNRTPLFVGVSLFAFWLITMVVAYLEAKAYRKRRANLYENNRV
jgi:hypothetical protein